jgi:hypothetical protein
MTRSRLLSWCLFGSFAVPALAWADGGGRVIPWFAVGVNSPSC